MTIWYRFWVYLLPLPMWLAEYFMRTIMNNPQANDFFPSSLAAAALGLIIPTLAPKPVPGSANIHIPSKLLLANRGDESVRQAEMMLLFLGTPLWLLTVYLSIGGSWPDGWPGATLDQKFWIGAILYLLAFALNEWKVRA